MLTPIIPNNKKAIVKGILKRYSDSAESLSIAIKSIIGSATQEEIEFYNNYKSKVKLWTPNASLDTIWIDYITRLAEMTSEIDTNIADVIGLYGNITYNGNGDVRLDVLPLLRYIYLASHISELHCVCEGDLSEPLENGNSVSIRDMPIAKFILKKGNTIKTIYSLQFTPSDIYYYSQNGEKITVYMRRYNINIKKYNKGWLNTIPSLDNTYISTTAEPGADNYVWSVRLPAGDEKYYTKLDFNVSNTATPSGIGNFYAVKVWREKNDSKFMKLIKAIFPLEAEVGENTIFVDF